MMRRLFWFYKVAIVLLTVVAVFSVSCNNKTYSGQPFKDTTILFVGNSLTYTNDLPKLVADFARSKGMKIKTEILALPNYALLDHMADGQLQKIMSTKRYSYVIVQQGPSSQADGRAWLLNATRILKDLCTANGAQLAFYMVWPAYADYANFEGVIKNYSDAASTSNSILCPVGRVWKEYIDRTGDLSYYGPDLFHPSLKGSQVAAEVIFNSLFK